MKDSGAVQVDTVKVRVRDISDLHFDKKNARRHGPENLADIDDSIREFGMARSIVIDEDGTIIAGNGTVEMAGQAGFEKVIEIETTGSEIVAVKRVGLDERSKIRLAIADNRSAEKAEWNIEQLAEFATEDPDILKGFWSPKEIELLLGASVSEEEAGGQSIPEQFIIVVECADEPAQTDILQKLLNMGLKAKPLSS